MIKNITARDTANAKMTAKGAKLVDMTTSTRGRLRSSVALAGTNGQVAISIGHDGIKRFYDGALVHEEKA